MILSNVELHKALDDRRIIITPEPLPRLLSVGGEHCPYDTHSVDLRLSPEIVVPRENNLAAIDFTQGGSIATYIAESSTTFISTAETPYILNPKKFVLAKTVEKVHLPILEGFDTCLSARIEGKSSRARFGLLVHFTAPTVHPGFEGTLTLEMINLGTAPLILKPDMAIAQLIVEEVKGIPNLNPSQFQGQSFAAGVLVANGKKG